MLVISNRSSEDFVRFLDDYHFDYIFTIDNPNLDPRVADHPDLSLFVLNENDLVVDKNMYDYYKDQISNKNIIVGEPVGPKYPLDSIYNIYKGSDFYIHNDLTEKNVTAYLSSNQYKYYQIKQGYTRCSIIPMGDKILTSDYGIYKALRGKLEVVLLPQEEIRLDGFATGFIGGTCGLVGDRLIFNGDITKLSAYPIIENEASKSGIEVIFPACELVDTGSIIDIL